MKKRRKKDAYLTSNYWRPSHNDDKKTGKITDLSGEQCCKKIISLINKQSKLIRFARTLVPSILLNW